MSQGSPYELDYYAWLNAQAALLRSGSLQGLDVEHLAEEVEAMGKSQRRELLARARILVAHLLKYRLQPERRSRGWAATIMEQRLQLLDLLEQMPSLQSALRDELARIYVRATGLAARETGCEPSVFPDACPFTVEEILDVDYLP